PVQLTSFVGREQQVEEVTEELADSRLVTLTGTGGIGKSRLALQVGAELGEAYPDGVWLVELASLTNPALVVGNLASTLGVREEPDRPLLETLTEYLVRKSPLIVLDNCEHLVEACASLVSHLLRSCPNLDVLATSREALGVPGESIWQVSPLSMPGPGGGETIEGLMEYEAVRLFAERASSVQSSFMLTQQTAPVVGQICQRLDGIPLAIELAAARVRVLSIGQIAERLEDRFRLLTSGSRTTLPRQRTLRAAVEWGYDLLDEHERSLFNGLSVFSGGFSLEAVESVCAGEGADEYETLDLLSSLVDKSMVMVVEGMGGSARYRLLETLREYGWERLEESGKTQETHRKHAAHFVALAEESEPELAGPHQASWLKRLQQEHDNLRAALRWSVESEDAETGLRLGGALWRFWQVRGHLSEGRKGLAGVLALPGASESIEKRAKALNGLGALTYDQGDYDAARPLWAECLAMRRELEDMVGVAASLNNLGNLTYHQGDHDAARPLHEESLAIKRELGDRSGVATSLNNMGLMAFDRSDYADARVLMEESLAIRKEIGDKRVIAGSLGNLGLIAKEQGDYPGAYALYEETLSTMIELGHRHSIPSMLENFASLAVALSQPERSLCLAGAAATLRESIAIPLLPLDESKLNHDLEPARHAMSEEAQKAAWGQGQQMTLEQAVAYALEESDDY
ncbi:MAG: tetratricopeptide repeat protein, partial [SAR202 cluster bacterium]|nr:tetratricopeptide repeat protein [SAR202 cluster bacterium]